ncbi:conserved hypothetical protein [Segniliparus rotundus DSM 44985]|uniref:Uncharacterized protein n=1 Tax=Segniliparus rotundus (strain ATCC BAA-972 / CDC 1076 / CIP 108378 / DSM 44985 / JCM 13578) TaxID=640132 RepID=D6ZB61_SEGRD|nr:hypothetical protein [Segniliparus rotundus]ADG96820.1 conserved hypothetical protein [Segniliparus rotundus DSM 44985]
MADNGVLTVNAEELNSYAGAIRGETPAAQALSQNAAEALSSNGAALGGNAAKAAAALAEAWAAADEAYLRRLESTAEQIEASAALYAGNDDSAAHAVRLNEQDGDR